MHFTIYAAALLPAGCQQGGSVNPARASFIASRPAGSICAARHMKQGSPASLDHCVSPDASQERRVTSSSIYSLLYVVWYECGIGIEVTSPEARTFCVFINCYLILSKQSSITNISNNKQLLKTHSSLIIATLPVFDHCNFACGLPTSIPGRQTRWDLAALYHISLFSWRKCFLTLSAA
jgi:hypothetical protein